MRRDLLSIHILIKLLLLLMFGSKEHYHLFFTNYFLVFIIYITILSQIRLVPWLRLCWEKKNLILRTSYPVLLHPSFLNNESSRSLTAPLDRMDRQG